MQWYSVTVLHPLCSINPVGVTSAANQSHWCAPRPLPDKLVLELLLSRRNPLDGQVEGKALTSVGDKARGVSPAAEHVGGVTVGSEGWGSSQQGSGRDNAGDDLTAALQRERSQCVFLDGDMMGR